MIKMVAQYLYNILVMTSQAFSVILGGHPDRSISQRTGEAFLAHEGKKTFKSYWFLIQMKLIDMLFWNFFFKIEKNHCLNSLKGESTAKELWNWNK